MDWKRDVNFQLQIIIFKNPPEMKGAFISIIENQRTLYDVDESKDIKKQTHIEIRLIVLTELNKLEEVI